MDATAPPAPDEDDLDAPGLPDRLVRKAETAVLGRLRSGYRVLRLRDPPTGTRVELCTLFVRITRGAVPHEWATLKELRCRERALRAQLAQRTVELEQANALVGELHGPS